MATGFSMESQAKRTERLLKALSFGVQRATHFRNRLATLDSRIALGRLLGTLIVCALLASIFRRFDAAEKLAALLAFAAVFFVAAAVHRRFQRKAAFWKSMVVSLEMSRARIDRDFATLQKNASPWHAGIVAETPKGHVYATDLDLASHVFLWLDTCATPEASHKLYQELLLAGVEPCAPEVVLARQTRALALARHSQILRDMECLRLDEDFLAAFAQQSLDETHTIVDAATRITAQQSVYLRSGFALVSIVAWAYLLLPSLVSFFQTADAETLGRQLMIYALFPLAGAALYKPLVDLGNRLRRQTRTLQKVLEHMKQVQTLPGFDPFSCLGEHASRRIARLCVCLDLLTLRGNPVLWLALHLIIPFDAILCLALTFQVRNVVPRLQAWWEETIDFDFLCALARMKQENPTFQFVRAESSASLSQPSEKAHHKSEQRSAQQSPQHSVMHEIGQTLELVDMGHPLIPAATRVCNTVSLSPLRPLVLLTGSNMAGKSTFLRTLGLNMVLHNLGAPVCAAGFVAKPHRILCAIRVDDSLSDGTSYFYAEVKRLKLILESLTSTDIPALFLVDEIFRGTNNRERFLGSWHMLHAFLGTGTFGVVSTHDLALTELEAKDQRLRNMHFREHVQAGRLIFDFLLREGPCPTTNALHIMRTEGLPIPIEAFHES